MSHHRKASLLWFSIGGTFFHLTEDASLLASFAVAVVLFVAGDIVHGWLLKKRPEER